MPPIEFYPGKIPTYMDWMIIRDFCAIVIHIFMKLNRDLGKPETQVVFPERLAKPYVESMKALDTRVISATGYHTFYSIKNHPKNIEDLTLDDIVLTAFNTTDQYN